MPARPNVEPVSLEPVGQLVALAASAERVPSAALRVELRLVEPLVAVVVGEAAPASVAGTPFAAEPDTGAFRVAALSEPVPVDTVHNRADIPDRLEGIRA